jgi:catechol 2,3-dioxygenase-like lactoylglutathione lyase family enzyme
MAIQALDHFNITAAQPLLSRVRDFYIDVIGLSEGYRPDFGFAGHWLYAGDRPLLHLMDASEVSGAGTGDGQGTGCLDHIAFSCDSLAATEHHLQAQGVDYKKREVPQFGLVQLFLLDPIGLGVEMNFAAPGDEGTRAG